MKNTLSDSFEIQEAADLLKGLLGKAPVSQPVKNLPPTVTPHRNEAVQPVTEETEETEETGEPVTDEAVDIEIEILTGEDEYLDDEDQEEEEQVGTLEFDQPPGNVDVDTRSPSKNDAEDEEVFVLKDEREEPRPAEDAAGQDEEETGDTGLAGQDDSGSEAAEQEIAAEETAAEEAAAEDTTAEDTENIETAAEGEADEERAPAAATIEDSGEEEVEVVLTGNPVEEEQEIFAEAAASEPALAGESENTEVLGKRENNETHGTPSVEIEIDGISSDREEEIYGTSEEEIELELDSKEGVVSEAVQAVRTIRAVQAVRKKDTTAVKPQPTTVKKPVIINGESLDEVLKQMCQAGEFHCAVLADGSGLPLAVYNSPAAADKMAAFSAIMGDSLDKAGTMLNFPNANNAVIDIDDSNMLLSRKFLYRYTPYYMMLICPQGGAAENIIELSIERITRLLDRV